MDGWKMNFLLGWPNFKGYVTFAFGWQDSWVWWRLRSWNLLEIFGFLQADWWNSGSVCCQASGAMNRSGLRWGNPKIQQVGCPSSGPRPQSAFLWQKWSQALARGRRARAALRSYSCSSCWGCWDCSWLIGGKQGQVGVGLVDLSCHDFLSQLSDTSCFFVGRSCAGRSSQLLQEYRPGESSEGCEGNAPEN